MIKKKSLSHNLLLMIASAKGAPKSVSTLMFMSNRKSWEINKSISTLLKYGYIYKDLNSEFGLTPSGKSVLLNLTADGSR